MLIALAHVIRQRRGELGLSQEHVGPLHRNSIGEIERAETAPTVLQLDRIADALGLRASELLAAAEALVDTQAPLPDLPQRRGPRSS